LHIGIQGAKPDVENRPALNLVFLIDTSGSMHDPDKLPLLKQSFRLLLNTLRPTDKVAIVTYAGSAGTVLEPTAASDKDKILQSLERLQAGGSTAGQAGLRQAYALAENMQTDDSIGRVLLATDGDFNVGISDPEELKRFVEEKRETGVYLSVFGFGNGNYRDDMMQTLAQNGNGVAAYIDTLSEAQKVMVDQVSGALFPIANDVKIQVEFNPALIAEYRLIGYETRALNREDFNNDAVDAGEIGAGHTVTAIYEITPVGSPAIKNDALRYQTVTADQGSSDEYGFLKLRYKAPGASKSTLITTAIPAASDSPSQEAKFAASIAGFGQLLTKSKYLNGWTWDQNITLANAGKGTDLYGYRTEAMQLMRLAQSLK
jgi:Ca-activated chloride channel family protein